MMTFLTISVFTLLGLLLVGGFFGIMKYKSVKNKLKEKDTEVKKSNEKLKKSNKELQKFHDLCDYRVGLWSDNLHGGSIGKRDFDVEVIIIDQCEGKSKIKIIEVIEKLQRWSNMEQNIKDKYDGQWIDSDKIKELSNSKILTREKRMSNLLDNE